ncbi:hypothetical protein PANO111632_20990 [Paracoccus nototheniae]
MQADNVIRHVTGDVIGDVGGDVIGDDLSRPLPF